MAYQSSTFGCHGSGSLCAGGSLTGNPAIYCHGSASPRTVDHSVINYTTDVACSAGAEAAAHGMREHTTRGRPAVWPRRSFEFGI